MNPTSMGSPIRYSPRLQLKVNRIQPLSLSVSEIALVREDGLPLPSYPPGSNLPIQWKSTGYNSYSLTGHGHEPAEYTISVQRVEDGEGGSRWAHRLSIGDTVECVAPRAAFSPLLTAAKHLLVCAGIGVTPILSHARAHSRSGADFEVHYIHGRGPAVHLRDLERISRQRLHGYSSRGTFWSSFNRVLAEQPLGTHLYLCGPQSMIDDVIAAAQENFWPQSRLHYEAFTADHLDEGKAFRARLVKSFRVVDVPEGTSLLEALEASGVNIPNMCRKGVCGECRIQVRSGSVEHRDHFLRKNERDAGDVMMACVSRSVSEELELDL